MSAAGAAAPVRWQEATIERVLHRTPRVVSIFLRSALPRHEAGQHVDVRLTAADGYSAQRSYSIASAPEDGALELAIEMLTAGEVSPYFHEVARVGDVIDIRGPIGGHFVWRERDGGPLLLIGGGSGVVPLVAILRRRARTAPAPPALLVYSARTWDEVIFRDELLERQGRESELRVILAITRGVSPRRDDYERRLDARALRELVARWGKSPAHVYVCGSNAFVESVSQALVGNGIPAACVRTERFGGAG